MSNQASPASQRPVPWLLVGGAVVVALIGGVIGGVIGAGTSSSSTSANACSVPHVADRVLPSVVTIAASSAQAGGTGSGEVIRSNGYILTNNHVISPAASGGSVQVRFSDGATAPATITGRDPRADLAVVKVSVSHALPVIPFGSSRNVRVGEPVVALGAPLGLSSTVTSGIVSALDRTVQVPGDNGRPALLVSAIQTDAAINPGNSGGALTDCAGNMIGVPTAGATVPSPSGQSSAGSVGLAFAIPVDFARTVADEIISTGSVSHAFFGLQVAEIPPVAAQRYGSSEGLYVSGVAPGGPAAGAGLEAGDIITEIDGKPATDPNQVAALSLTKRAGDAVAVTYQRDGRSTSTTITLTTQS